MEGWIRFAGIMQIQDDPKYDWKTWLGLILGLLPGAYIALVHPTDFFDHINPKKADLAAQKFVIPAFLFILGASAISLTAQIKRRSWFEILVIEVITVSGLVIVNISIVCGGCLCQFANTRFSVGHISASPRQYERFPVFRFNARRHRREHHVLVAAGSAG